MPTFKVNNARLDHAKVILTIHTLTERINDRFPSSGLSRVCQDLGKIASKGLKNLEWIKKPHFLIRTASFIVITISVIGLIFSFSLVDLKISTFSFTDIVTILEAVINDVVLIGAAIFFMITLENRIKRAKAIKVLNELRAIVVDMHQLTKDPHRMLSTVNKTEHSPELKLSKFQLQRYLGYCAEVQALIGKIAALYSQNLPDDIVVRAVNEIENLTTGFSRKVWQKLIMLNEIDEEARA